MYESPIVLMEKVDKISKDFGEKLEDHVVEVIRSYYVDVDKEELVKALKYDREQYDKGYREGYERGVEVGKRENINPCSDCQEFECDYCEHAVERRIEEALL